MRLTLCWFGYELDFSFGPTKVDDDPVEYGYTTSTPVGFTRAEVPWEDAGSLHQFDPDE